MTHYCVISHTHWDREWYLTQEVFRLKLADLIDHVLALLEREAEYVFHLDAQTIVLEDYFEIRPENKMRCRRMIAEGRLLVGPWYVQNDFMLTSGEATVRNLLLGIRQAEGYGRCMRVGYAPDQFGLISQLPQILRQFDLDSCIFGRGYHDFTVDESGEVHERMLPAEFSWRAPDGSEVLAVCMSYWYNNTQRFSADIGKALALARLQRERFAGVAQTPHLLCMNGCDHLEAQEDLLPVLRSVQSQMDADEKIEQTTLEQYLCDVRTSLERKTITVQTGELTRGRDENVLKDTNSSRIYLKTQNAALQDLLERRLEVLYTVLEVSGMDGCYPKGTLDFLWKMLIRNHAHDSICGCSKDAVHWHMEDRFAAIQESAEELERRAMTLLNAHVSREGFGQDDYLITAFNPLPHARTAGVDVRLDVMASDAPSGLTIYAPDGSVVPYVLLGETRVNRRVTSPLNLPGFVETVQYDIRLLARDVPPCGSVSYRVCTDVLRERHVPVCTTDRVLENAFLRAEITLDGKLDLLHKASGRWYRDVLTLEDTADTGHSYISVPLAGDVPVGLHETRPLSIRVMKDAISQRAELHFVMTLPAGLTADRTARSAQTVECPVALTLRLDAAEPFLRALWELENRAKDHRLRMLVKTGVDADMTTALSPFDLVEHCKSEIDTRICNETRHNSGFVDLSDENGGMSVLNLGVYGYENLQKCPGTLAFTLLRATSRVWPEDSEGSPEDDAWDAPENQCLRTVRLETALYPHTGDVRGADVPYVCDCFRQPFLAAGAPVDTRKFRGGRPALQEAAIAEFFYQDDPYPAVRTARRQSLLRLDGGIQMTALKKSEDGREYVLRFFSTEKTAQTAKLYVDASRIRTVWHSDLQERRRERLIGRDGAYEIPMRAGEIVTLRLGRTEDDT